MFRSEPGKVSGVRTPVWMAALLAAALAGGTAIANAQTAKGKGSAKAAEPASELASKPWKTLGRLATPDEIKAWDIDVRPDGTGLPKGKGTVLQGQDVYEAKCASCHGVFGESNAWLAIAGGVRKGDVDRGRASILSEPEPVRTVGTKLNYATTLWDYINRAMPFTNPKTLTVEEVYAVTAYVLHLNEIVPEDFELNEKSLLAIRMPNRNGFTTDHGLSSVRGKPDVKSVACMKNCEVDVAVRSILPEYARNAHGNLAEQRRMVGPLAYADTTQPPLKEAPKGMAKAAVKEIRPANSADNFVEANVNPQDLARKSACFSCHGVDRAIVGPGFTDVAGRYKGEASAEQALVYKVRNGGQGNWGTIPMPPHATMKESEIRSIVRWILAGAKAE